MSPQAFLELRRLHRFRRFLFAAPRLKGAITKAAMQSGITHMGRLSERYRKQFGESPSEALKRRLRT
jgi:transcriptional regulator GlxA family with amidase domain